MTHAVTGADGFIGSHLVEALVARGERVRALALYTSMGGWGWLDTLPRDVLAEVEVVAGDVRDPEQMARFAEGVDTLFHLAALIAIPYSYVAPRARPGPLGQEEHVGRGQPVGRHLVAADAHPCHQQG